MQVYQLSKTVYFLAHPVVIVSVCFDIQEPIDIEVGITDAQARKMAAFLQFEGSKQDDATEQIKRLYALFLKLDATQIEINPFGETPDGEGTFSVYFMKIESGSSCYFILVVRSVLNFCWF